MNVASASSQQNSQVKVDLSRLDSHVNASSANAVNHQLGSQINLQKALNQGNTNDIAGFLKSNPQERNQVYNQLLKTDPGMIHYLEQLANSDKAVNGAGVDLGSGVSAGATVGASLGASAKADGYKTGKAYKELSKEQQAAVNKQVDEFKQTSTYKNASDADKTRMSEAVGNAAILAAKPDSKAAQNAVAKTLNDENTAKLLNDNKTFASQFLKSTGGHLEKAVDAYLKLRPKGAVNDALGLIGNSNFAKTAEGQKVLLKSLTLDRTGNIDIKDLGGGIRGQWGSGKITVDDQFAGSAAGIATEIVHEATHAVDDNDYPGKVYSIDEEMRTNTNQIAFYKEVNKSEGYTDAEMDRRINNPVGGSLRSDIRDRYPTLPEHRYPPKNVK
jgi:hypothetical protein